MVTKKNFRTKISLVCSTDSLRPSLTHVYFDNGFAVATDAHILIKSPLKEHGFEREEIELLQGK